MSVNAKQRNAHAKVVKEGRITSNAATKFFVLLENDKPIGVAREDRKDLVYEWVNQGLHSRNNRRFVMVEEMR